MKLMSALSIYIFTSILFSNIDAVAQEVPLNSNDICPILIGEKIPDGIVKNIEGEDVSISDLIKLKPTVLVFYRGGWCPYCNKQLAGLNKIEVEIDSLGFQLLAISPDNPTSMMETMSDKELKYTLLSDASMKYANKLGIAFKVDDKTIKKYKTFGIDLEKASGENHFQLPAPAVFVLDKKGVIQFSYVNPNYKVRLDPEVLLAVLNSI